MCGLCGMFGERGDWTTPSVELQPREGRTRRAERAQRVRLANRVLNAFALSLDDWQGTSFVVRSATGSSEMAATISEVWKVAEKMLGRPIDPLDPGLLARLGRSVQ